MYIQYLSDLHLEFFPHPFHKDKLDFIEKITSFKQSDVMILAGDVSSSNRIIQDLYLIESYYKKPIIFICGNHEFYNSQKCYVDRQLEEIDHKNIHVLNNSYVTIDNYIFIGSTGWWDESNGQLDNFCINGMNDFYYIHDIKQNDNGVKWGKDSYKFFMETLKSDITKNKKIICISHNSPITSCFMPFDQGDLDTCSSNNWPELFENYNIKLWVHGHTHESRYEKLFGTWVACNPHGYYLRSVNKKFGNKSIKI